MRSRSQVGFTLIELLVTSFVLVVLVLAVLAMFDFAARMSRAQTELANLQQAQRIAQHELVRMVRMAGRGGLLPAAALVVRNDRPADDPILTGGGSGVPRVAEHSDVMIIRGIFTGELFQLDTTDPTAFTYDAANNTGTLTLRSVSSSGVPQDVAQIEDVLADEDDVPEALLIVSAVDDNAYAVVELDPAVPVAVTVDETTVPATRSVTFGFLAQNAAGGRNTNAYGALSSVALISPQMQSVAYAGVLEEYRFYVREQAAQAGVPGSGRALELARARVYPGTELAYRGEDSNLSLTVAENILDLQASFGVDQDADGIYEEGESVTDKKNDDWGFNVAGDVPPIGAPAFVRLTTVARSDRPDPAHEADLLADVEDRVYAGDALNASRIERLYRRWPLQSLIDLRNM